MRARIGKELIRGLSPGDKPYEIVDTELKGFLLRVQPSGSMTYYLAYRTDDGRKTRYRIGSHGTITAPQAREVAKGLAKLVASGQDIQARKKTARREAELAKARTLQGFIDHKYRAWAENHLKRGDVEVIRITKTFAHLLEKPINEITTWQMEKWRSERLKASKARTTVNRDIAGLKACLNKAIEWGVVDSHGLTALKPLRVDQLRRVRFLASEEEKHLRSELTARDHRLRTKRASANQWRAQRDYPLMEDLSNIPYPDHLHPMVLLSLNTGMRRGETFTLCWEDVDLSRRVITIRGSSSKSGNTRHIPLTSESVSVLNLWRSSREVSNLVFPSDDGGEFGSMKTAWANLMKKARIQNFRWHDMRHHFASQLVMAGVDLNTVRELLGHQSLEMTLRYAHLSEDHKTAAIEKLENQTIRHGS